MEKRLDPSRQWGGKKRECTFLPAVTPGSRTFCTGMCDWCQKQDYTLSFLGVNTWLLGTQCLFGLPRKEISRLVLSVRKCSWWLVTETGNYSGLNKIDHIEVFLLHKASPEVRTGLAAFRCHQEPRFLLSFCSAILLNRARDICLLINVPQAHINVPGFYFQDCLMSWLILEFQLLCRYSKQQESRNGRGQGRRWHIPSWKFQIPVGLRSWPRGSHLGHLGQARSYLAIREAVVCFSAFVFFKLSKLPSVYGFY